ncbi:MAG TPA: phosphoadenylyl-sulfate reductase [Kofleriaceae bacterium]|nr:phosphoadenylyl-sulfate reductase [Kofleriaceae bacterium]
MTSTIAIGDDELTDAAARLEGGDPAATLAWAAERFAPRLALASSFGPEDCVLIDVIGRHRLAIEVFTLDTGLFFDETTALWRALEARYGITVRAFRPRQTVDEQAAAHGPALWERQPDACCKLRKVEPLGRALSGLDAWVTGIRRDQTPDRATAKVVERDRRPGLIKLNPLAAWTSDDVWAYVRAHDVPVNPMHARGFPSIGCTPCTSPVAAGEDPRSGRWRGNAKTECGLHVEDGRLVPGRLVREVGS